MNSDVVNQFFDGLLKKIQKEFTKKIEIDDITLVNCALFEKGLCQQISTENITLKKKQIYFLKQWILRIMCVIFSLATCIFCYSDRFDSTEVFLCSLLTIISSSISLYQFIREYFFQK